MIDPKHLESGARADDVDDGVDTAHLVELDVVDRRVVHRSFGFAEGVKDGE